MLDTNHSSRYGLDTTIADRDAENGPALANLTPDAVDGESTGGTRSHVRGEVYGGS